MRGWEGHAPPEDAETVGVEGETGDGRWGGASLKEAWPRLKGAGSFREGAGRRRSGSSRLGWD